MDAGSGAVVARVGQDGQILQERAQHAEHVLAGGGQVVDVARQDVGDPQGGCRPGLNRAWMFPPKSWVLPAYHKSMVVPLRLVVFFFQ